MSRLPGKTGRQPIGQWPRHRAITLEVQGFSRYPDVPGGEPGRVVESFHALNGEQEAAIRRGAHKALDRALDAILPRLATPEPERVIWRMPPSPTPGNPYTWAHRVKKRSPGKLALMCGVQVTPAGAIFGGPRLEKNWGTCPACKAGRPWTGDDFAAAFLNGGTQ